MMGPAFSLRRAWPAARSWQRAQTRRTLTAQPSPRLMSSTRPRADDEALPVVALESTIITHGLPWPINLETALACEAAVRDAGARPATIALLDGRAHVGLEAAELERIARCAIDGGAERAVKTGERDIAAVLARGGVGGTTVSATLHLARLAHIEFFATGGIGGVHRGAETSFDISSDLTALARAQGTSVFCSGVKSILSIGQTLEYLETMGVNVMSFNSTGEFPAFYSAQSGFFVPSVEGPAHAARVIQRSLDIAQPGANLFAVPIPEQYEAAGREIARAVEQAVAESEANGMAKRGKEVTPWLLKRVGELSASARESNVALVVNNAATAAQTAVELYERRRRAEPAPWGSQRRASGIVFGEGCSSGDPADSAHEKLSAASTRQAQSRTGGSAYADIHPGDVRSDLVVFGCAALDFTAKARPVKTDTLPAGPGKYSPPHLGDTVPGNMWVNAGGVARNIAEAASRLHQFSAGSQSSDGVCLVAPVAADQQGETLRRMMDAAGMRTDGLFAVSGASTATATMVLSSDGGLIKGIVDMGIVEQHFDPSIIKNAISPDPVVALDCNIPLAALRTALSTIADHPRAVLLVEPTSEVKSRRLISAYANESPSKTRVDFCTPNVAELRAMFQAACEEKHISAEDEKGARGAPRPDEAMALCLSRLLGDCCMLVKDGGNGVLSVRAGPQEQILHHDAHAPPSGGIVSSTGAGDTFAGCMLALSRLSLRQGGLHPAQWSAAQLSLAIDISQQAACLSLTTQQAVSPRLKELLPSRFEEFKKALVAAD